MTKRTSRQPPGQVEDIGHLDETLTEITSTTAATLKKYRYPILGAIGVVSLIAVGIAVGVGIHERGLTSENEALWSLLQSPAAESAGPSLGAIDGLLEDARGTLAERYIVKSVGEYLLFRAVADPEDATATAGVPKEQAYQRALALASEARTRFPDDADIQKWAGSMQAKLEGEHDTAWMPPSPEYRLPAPTAPAGSQDSPSESRGD